MQTPPLDGLGEAEYVATLRKLRAAGAVRDAVAVALAILRDEHSPGLVEDAPDAQGARATRRAPARSSGDEAAGHEGVADVRCRPDRARPIGVDERCVGLAFERLPLDDYARRDATLRNVAQGPKTTEPRRRGSRRHARPGRERGRGWQGQCARCWTLTGGQIGNSRTCSARGDKRW